MAQPGRSANFVAMRRIQSELKQWNTSPPEGCRLLSCEPLTEWVVLMEGPETSAAPGGQRLYAGETYQLRIKFADHYPLEPPDFVFIPPSPEHMHIYSNGFICLDVLYASRNGGWSPAMTVASCCLSIRSMLASATRRQPPCFRISNPAFLRPPGDKDFCRRGIRSPKDVNWMFDDATV